MPPVQLSAVARVSAAHFEIVENNLFERLALRGVDEVAEFVFDAAGEFIHAGLGHFDDRFRADQVELDVAHVREDGGLNIFVLVVDGRDAGIGDGFADHGRLEGPGRDVTFRQNFGKAGQTFLVEEGLDFAGRSGEQHD